MGERIENEMDLIEKLVISIFSKIRVSLQKAVTKRRKKKLKKGLLLNTEKGDEDSALD